MSDEQAQAEERPCLHCLIVDLIEDFFEEYPAPSNEAGVFDTDEVIMAVAKTVAEMTCKGDAAERRKMIEHLTREITTYDEEFREQDAMGIPGSDARH
jgi:hypothetical protein